MKMIKKANGKTELYIKREEWENIGKKHGWKEDFVRTAQNISNIPHLLMVHGLSSAADKVVNDTKLPMQTIETDIATHPEDSRTESLSIINSIFNASNTVFVVKEIDRLIKIGDEIQESSKPILKWLLNILEGSVEKLKKNNVYVILMSDSDVGVDHNIPIAK